MKTSKRTRFASIFLSLLMVVNLFPFTASAVETESVGGDAVAELASTNSQASAVDSENADEASNESASVPVASYTVSIALPGQGVALADGQSKELLAQTVSAGSAMESIRLVSTYADEPFDESIAGAFNSRLFAGTGLSAKCDANGVITISGSPTANVAVNLADAFAEDAPTEVADNTAVYVATATATDSYTSPLGNDSTGDGTKDKPYATISKAYSAVVDGGTIYLLSDLIEKDAITFGTAKTVTITSAVSSDVKTIYSKVSFGYENRWFFNVNSGHVVFKNITIDGEYQKNKNGNYYAPGAVVASGATVTIDSGTTIQNFKKNAGNSGGAAVVKSANKGAVVNIRDGVTIKNCVLETGSADDPAAVLSSGTGAILYMTGGTVTGNTLSTSQANTTAVVNIGKYDNPHFWMTGGEIKGNTINNGAAAVYMRGEASACDIEFGDTAYVYDNYVNGTSGDQRNIYLKNDKDGSENSNVYVKLCSALSGNTKLGVYAEKIGMGTKVAQGGGVSGVGTGSYTATSADASRFVSDKATDAEILYCGGDDTTCGLLQHKEGTTHEKAIYLSVSPTVTATKNTTNGQIDLSIARCTSDATYVVLDKDLKPVTGKTLSGGTYVTDGKGTFALNSDASTTTIDMAGLDKASGPYTVMLVSGTLSVGDDGKASTDNLTDIATVNVVNFAGKGVKWSDGANSFESGDFDIVTVPHNDQTGKANKTYTATTKTNYTFAADNAITASGNLGDATVTDDTDGSKAITVEVPAYGTTSKGTTNYNTVTLTGSAVKGDPAAISVSVDKVTADNENNVGTLNESLTATLSITDANNYAVGTTPTYKYTVTNGRDASGDVTATAGEGGSTKYSITGLKYGDHVKVYVDGEDVPAAYFKVLNTAIENGSFENVSAETNAKMNYQRKTGIGIAAWHTTASDQNMEVDTAATYKNTLSPDGGNVAELNALEASSLYQEISTTPGSTLGWTMYHTARTNYGSNTQTMAIVIGPALNAVDSDPYKKSNIGTDDMFMSIAAQIQDPVVGETYYTKYNGKTYQVTIASDAKQSANNNIWTQYSSTYTVPDGQTETVFAFASIDTTSQYKAGGNLIDGVGFGTGVAITQAKAAKNSSDTSKIDISIENSTKNGVYVVLDKDMKPVIDKELTGGEYVTGGNGTFKLTSSDDGVTTVGMAELDKASGPYTVMRVMSGTLSVDGNGKASTTNLTDIATVNIVNFAGEGVSWSDGTTSFENGGYDIVTVPHDDQTGKATKTYTATAKNGYALAAENPVTGKLDNGDSTAVTVTATTNEDGSKAFSVTVPDYGTTSKGTTNYNTVTLAGATTISAGVKLLDKTDGTEMTVTEGVASKTYDGVAVAHTAGSVDGATLSYTWQKKNAEGAYSDIEGDSAPSDAGDYNLKITATKTDGTTVLGTQDLPFTISPKALTVTATAQDKTYDGKTDATVDASLDTTGVVEADKDKVTLVTSSVSATFGDKKVGTGKSVTLTGGYTLSGTAAGNYTVTQPTGLTANITAKEVSISGLSASKAYDGDATAEKSEIGGDPVIGNKALDTDDVSLNTESMAGTFDSADAGENKTVTITGLSLAGTDADNYKLPKTVTCKGTITKADGSGTVKLDGWTYGEAAKTPVPTSDTNGTDHVTYRYKPKGADDNTYSDTVPSDAGEYTVEATFAATNNHNAAVATTNFTIGKKSLTVNATAEDKTYNGKTDATLQSATPDGVLDADKENVALDNSKITVSFVDKNAGDSKEVTVSAADGALTGNKADNYTITTAMAANAKISPKTVTATITAENKTYNGSADATVSIGALSDVISGDKVSATASNAVFVDGSGVGDSKTVTADIALSGDDAGNYALTSSTASATANITAKELGVTVEASSKTYDGTTDATATVTLKTDDVVKGDTVSLDNSSMKATFENAEVGTNKTVTVTGLKLTGTSAKNYKLPDSITAKASITQAAGSGTVTLEGWTYGETAKTPNPTSETNPGSESSPIAYQYKVKDAADSTYTADVPTNAGEYTVKATFPANVNYAATTATADFTIAKKTLTAKITVKDKTYDGADTAEVTKVELTGMANDEAVTATASDAKFAGVNAGNGQTVTADIALNDPTGAAKNYTVADKATATASITAKTLTVTATVSDKVYDGTTNATITKVELSGKVGDDTVSLNKKGMTASFENADAGESKTVKVSGLALDNNENGNYKLPDSITATANITKANGSGSVELKGWTYGDEANAPTANSTTNPGSESSPITYQYKAKDADDNTYSGTVPTKAGAYTVKATFPANTNYTAATATADFTISPKALTVNVAAADKVYDGTANATLGAATLVDVVEADKGKVALETSDVAATFDNKNVGTDKSITLTGSYTITGDAAKNYTVTQPTGLKANVTAAPLTITGATVTAKTYDGTDGATVTGVAFSGLKNGETLAADTDYTVSDAKYDHANATGDDAATRVDFKVALANTDLAKNYTLTADAGSQDATIAKASHSDSALTTKGNRGEENTLNGVSAYVVESGTVGAVATDGDEIFDGTPTYDSNTGKLTYTLKSEATESQTATVTLPVTSANYSDYKIVVTVGVTPKETVKIGITSQNYEYSGTAHAPTGITVTDNKVLVDALEVTYEGAEGTVYEKSSVAPTNAGKYVVTVKVPDDNTKYTGSATCAFEITKKALTATISAEDKTYDGNATATVTAALDGVVGNDDVTADVTNPAFDGKNVGTGKKVTAAIALAGAAANNYTVNATAETTASISAKEVSIDGVTVADSKTYDRSASATPVMTNAKIDGKVATDNLAIAAGTANYDNTNVGENKTVTFTGFALEGDDASNYKLKEQPASTTADITAKEVSISGTAIETSKVYDGTTDAKITASGKLTGVLDGDTVTVKAGKATYNDKTAGESKAVAFSGFELQGKDSGNYTLKEQPAAASAAITQREVTISGLSATKTYDGDNTAAKSEITGTPVVGNKAVESDEVSLNTGNMAGTFNSENVDEATTVTLSGLSLTGNDADNYKLPQTVTCAGKITKANGAGTVKLNGWTYGDKANAPQPTSNTNGTASVTYQYKVKDADDNTYSGTVPTKAGDYTVKATFAATNNYTAATATADFTISPKELTVNVAAQDKVYDGTKAASLNTATLDGVVKADANSVTLEASGVSAAFNDKNVGTDKPITLTGSYTLSGDAAKNYTVAQPTGLTASITAREVSITGVTVEGSKTYDKSTAAAITSNGAIDGKVETDSLTITAGTANYDNANVGTGKTVSFTDFALTGDDAKNYKLKEQPASTTADITAKEVSISDVAIKDSKTYDGTTAVEITSNGKLTGVLDGDTVIIKPGTAAYDDKTAGEGKAVTFSGFGLQGTEAGNYTLKEQPSNLKANIEKKALTATIAAQDKAYDGNTTATVTPSLEGVVGNDDVAANVSNPAFDGKNVGTGKKVTAAIALSGTAAGNYTVNSEATTTASITAKKVSITGVTVVGSKIYDKTTAAAITSNGTVDGKVATDNLTITVGTASYDNANAGTGKTVSFTGFGLAGDDASNYKLKEQPASTTADITAKEVTATIAAESKVFDGTTAAEATSTLTGAVAGDVVFAKITAAEFADANVAEGKQVTAAIELAGDAAGNYSVNKTATANANITAKALTLTIKANDKKLDGSDAAVLDTENATLDGMVSGHLVSVGSAKGTFENCNTASDAASVNVADVKLEGKDAGNYEITKINSVTAKLIPLYVTFMDGDAKLDEKTISVYGTAPTDVVSPEKSGYNFAGWYTDEDCTAPWNSKAGVTADATVYAKWSTNALYTLSGVVKQGDVAISDVAVTLYEGSVGIATATTDANGMYSFGNVPNGVYTITAKASDRAATTAVTVQDGDITQDIVLPAIAVAAEVQVAPGAPAATVSGIDKALVNALLDSNALIDSDGNKVTAPKDGERLEVKLNVKADASPAEKAAIQDAAVQETEKENTNWYFVNMDVDWSKYNHLEANIGSGNIADTVNVLAIRVPYDRNDKRDIVVYRHHMNGATAEVTQFTQLQSEPAEGSYTDGTCYVGDDYIMLYTQKFSAFGIGYIADSTDPVISGEGVEDGKTYCGPVTLTITDEKIAQVTVNGKEVSLDADGQLTLNPADGEQTVVAVDAARHSSSITVTVNNGHTYGEWESNGDGTHSRTCSVDTHVDTQSCHGGTATCSDRAVCDDCGQAYGEVNPGNHAALTHVDAKAATDSAEGNIEYWHCEDCGKYFADAACTKEIQQSDTVVAKKAASSDGDKGDSANGTGSGKSKVSRTGDSTAPAWPFAILGTAAVAAAVVSARRRRS